MKKCVDELGKNVNRKERKDKEGNRKGIYKGRGKEVKRKRIEVGRGKTIKKVTEGKLNPRRIQNRRIYLGVQTMQPRQKIVQYVIQLTHPTTLNCIQYPTDARLICSNRDMTRQISVPVDLSSMVRSWN